MSIPRYSIRALLTLTFVAALCVWSITSLSRSDDTRRIGQNEGITWLSRTFLTRHAQAIDDQTLRSFLDLDTPFRDGTGRECIGGNTRVEIAAPLNIRLGSIWIVSNHSDGFPSSHAFAVIVTDDSGRVVSWTLIEGLFAFDSFSRSQKGVEAETFLLQSESPLRKCKVLIEVSPTGEISIERDIPAELNIQGFLDLL